MKIIALSTLTLLLSFNALAIDEQKPLSQINNPISISQQESTTKIESISENKPNETATEIFVYLIIVMVYSLYWRNLSQDIDQ
jgi:hypothetical protein